MKPQLQLTCHAEIRNRIYDFATEKVAIDLRHHFCYEISSAPTSSWCDQGRCTIALTQTCQEIRVEYLPIYKANVECRIHYDDLEKYLQTFVLPPGTNIDYAIGDLSIKFYPTTHDINERFDILPLMELVDTTSHFNVRFYVASANIIKDHHKYFHEFFDTLLHSSRVPALHKYIQEAVTAVELCSDFWNLLHIAFRLKPDFGEVWMQEWRHDEDDTSLFDFQRGVEFWSSRLGLDLGIVKYFIDFWF